MNKNIVIIHYNTPHLTECLVRSINLFVQDAVIYVFDNSDKLPFVAEFDNVTVLDNTHGEIINFNKWLDNYPSKRNSHGRVNKWGSAKHCYSVEKCMEIVGENFMLMDSDILLKKDISELFDDECIYVGETIVQPASTIHRIQPFLCFINVDMCKENNVHYFDHNYMHGLNYTKNNTSADKYDTGAGFYVHASKYKHKDIKLGEYIVHYGHGSWKKAGERKLITPGEWLTINKSLWSEEKNKKVVYTCITGNYDRLKDPKYINGDFDYICFTDSKNMSSTVWDIRPLPAETEGLSQIKKQRYVKINAHKVLPEYELSIWVDGNVDILGDLNQFIEGVKKDGVSIYVPQHPVRKCIYDEAKIVIASRKDSKDVVNKQIERYKSDGFPADYGLLQSNIMLRMHNSEDCIRFMDAWFDELRDGSRRDQLSFNYVLWKNNDIKISYLDKYIYRSKWFNWRKGHSRVPTSAPSTHKLLTIKNNTSLHERREAFQKLIKTRRLKTHNIKIY